MFCFCALAQQIKNVLFIGNSYTYYNNLPQLLSSMASSTGDSIWFDSNTPGGYTLQAHSSDANTLFKIAQGNWDYVVLQEQSQRPSFPIASVQFDVFPYARKLDSLITLANPCTETAFYMTWGRKNGDANNCFSWPPVCTYDGMDSLLNLRYRMMADSNNAILSPVGAVWNYIRTQYPLIELYQADESHPSLEGSYAAALTFYTTILRKDPYLVNYDAGLPSSTTSNIKDAVKSVVFDSLSVWHVGEYDPQANFSFITNGTTQVAFTNTSINAQGYYWSFGDGNSSSLPNPVHQYTNNGIYTVMLIAWNCSQADTSIYQVNTLSTGIEEQNSQQTILVQQSLGNQNVILQLPPELQNSTLRVKLFSSLGECVLDSKWNNQSSLNLNIKNLRKGVYFIRINEKWISRLMII